MRKILNFCCRACRRIKADIYNKIYMPFLLSEFKKCGKDVVIGPNNCIAGMKNMEIGNHVYIGPGLLMYSTRANLTIGSYINFGPNVTIITGDHRIDVVGEYMKMVPETEKLPENDRDVVIEDDVWLGTGVIVLKGVHIGKGSVVAAGAIVTKDIPPYTVYYSKEKQKKRFTDEEITEHEKLIIEKYHD